MVIFDFQMKSRNEIMKEIKAKENGLKSLGKDLAEAVGNGFALEEINILKDQISKLDIAYSWLCWFVGYCADDKTLNEFEEINNLMKL